jgi:exoribonuclease-2
MAGEVQAAWELLAGETTTLPELAELAFGDYTPSTAWAVWQLVDDGLYFSGTPAAIVAHTPEEVYAGQAGRAAKVAEQQAWFAFLARAQAGQFAAEDERYLEEAAALALGQREQSRVLRALNRAETPQNAHSLLLATGYWNPTINPYPARMGAPTTEPVLPLPELPDESRRDLTHLVALAIDDEGSQDPDDALSWEDDRLWVHVADVAALVTPDSPADVEARARGANLYLPEGAVPMLPHEATQRLALGLTDISPALSFGIVLNDSAEVAHLEIVPSWVRVTRLSYEEAETRLEEAPLQQLHVLAQRSRARRLAHGAIEIDLPEAKVRVVDGEVVIRPLPALHSRDLVREAMLITGEAAARFALAHELPAPFTVQDAPDEVFQQGAASISAMFALRRLLKPSQQKGAPGSHAGLGMEVYTQCTSPLRRYADLLMHQQLRAYLRGDAPLTGQAMMERIASASAIMGALRRAERLSNSHWTLVYLLQHPDWRGEGIVVEQRGARSVLLLPDLALETEIYVERNLALDSMVRLALNEVNLPELTAHFRRL